MSEPEGDRPEPSAGGAAGAGAARRPIEAAVDARRRAQLVSGLRGFARAAPSARGAPSAAAEREGPATNGNGTSAGAGAAAGEERCELCATTIPAEHRHLLNLVERRIECVCESCWALRSGDAEYRPVGARTLWLPDLDLPEEVWASFQIPIGLAFFMESTVAGCVVALYPSPAGATESELHFSSWRRVLELNPILGELEPDIEGLVVNRLADPPVYSIAPIDRCYALTGAVKLNWDGISGGPKVREAVASFFEELRAAAVPA